MCALKLLRTGFLNHALISPTKTPLCEKCAAQTSGRLRKSAPYIGGPMYALSPVPTLRRFVPSSLRRSPAQFIISPHPTPGFSAFFPAQNAPIPCQCKIYEIFALHDNSLFHSGQALFWSGKARFWSDKALSGSPFSPLQLASFHASGAFWHEIHASKAARYRPITTVILPTLTTIRSIPHLAGLLT